MTKEELQQKIDAVKDKIQKAQSRIDYYKSFNEENFIKKQLKDIKSVYKISNKNCPFNPNNVTTMTQLYSAKLDAMYISNELAKKRWGDSVSVKEPTLEEATRLVELEKTFYMNDATVGIRDKERDIQGLTNTLTKYQLQLNKLTTFEKEEKVEIIWNFLQNWKKLAYEWYIRQSNNYVKALNDFHNFAYEWMTNHNVTNTYESKETYEEKSAYIEDVIKDFNEEVKRVYKYEPIYLYPRSYRGQHIIDANEITSKMDSFTKQLTSVEFQPKNLNDPYNYYRGCISKLGNNVNEGAYIKYQFDEERLNKTLEREVIAKYNNLINQVESIVGEITDAKDLHISDRGDINGIIVGTTGKARVETFSAGGWNIQCWHFRTRVTKLKY